MQRSQIHPKSDLRPKIRRKPNLGQGLALAVTDMLMKPLNSLELSQTIHQLPRDILFPHGILEQSLLPKTQAR